MRSFPKIVVSTCGLALLLIAGPSCSLPTSKQVRKIDDPQTQEWRKAVDEARYADALRSLRGSADFPLYDQSRRRGVQGQAAEEARQYRKDAEQGDVSAQFELAFMHMLGRGVPQDDAEAARWFRKAAEQGHVEAQSSLGYMNSQGRGVPQDYIEAHKWITLAVLRAKGLERKKDAATRDFVATKMTPEQIAEAQRRAREWKPGSGADKGGRAVK